VSESACAFFNPKSAAWPKVTHVQKEKDDPKRWAVFFVSDYHSFLAGTFNFLFLFSQSTIPALSLIHI